MAFLSNWGQIRAGLARVNKAKSGILMLFQFN